MNPFYTFNILSSLAATALRTGAGIATSGAIKQPAELLELYEFEGCPHCRLVREVLTELDLDALIKPCPKAGERFRPEVERRGGKAQFPYLIDPNTGTEMYESADIISYLYQTYGSGTVPLRWRAMELQRLGSVLASMPRLGAGVRVRASVAPAKPLELFSFESSPFARPVRDLLCELEIPYILRSMGRASLEDWLPPGIRGSHDHYDGGTRNRQFLQQRAGHVAVPYLIDSNTDTEMADSSAILEYLKKHYAV
ncbi:MAG: glutathione S-transferase N-terminal domain-containing protein [Pseudomonadota bacterium]